MSLTSELLPEPLNAGDADERAERDVDVDVFEVVVASADDAKRLNFGFRMPGIGLVGECFFVNSQSAILVQQSSFDRHFDLPLAAQKLAGHAA